MKFRIREIIETDDAGFLVLKGLLEEGSIVWCRSIHGKVYVRLDDSLNLEHLEKTLNSLDRTLRY